MSVTDAGATTTPRRAEHAPTTPSQSAVHTPQPTRPSAASDGLGRPADVPRGSWRERARSKPGLGHAYRVGVFAAGLLFIALGVALAVLPGPLTIPPVLIGLWIWSTEFRFAERFFDSFKRKAKEAWAHAKVHPSSSAAITIGGLAAAGVAMWAVSHFELIAKGKDAVGI
jgi:Putative transmembrane protein (PGPGW)